MIILGIILALLDWLVFHSGWLLTVGAILAIVGLVLWLVPVGGTRRRYY